MSEKEKKRAYTPRRFNHSGIDAFKVEAGKVRCKAGKYAIGKIRQEEGELFYFSTKDCRACGHRRECLGVKERRKRVWLSDFKKKKEYRSIKSA